VYVTLDRLEDKGMITSRLSDPTPDGSSDGKRRPGCGENPQRCRSSGNGVFMPDRLVAGGYQFVAGGFQFVAAFGGQSFVSAGR